MKTQYKILFLLFLCLGISSCNSDDNDKSVDTSNLIELEQSEVRIKLQEVSDNPIEGEEIDNEESVNENINSASIQILEGNGDYAVFSLNEKVATASYSEEHNAIIIEGKTIGKTKVFVVDQDIQSAEISVFTYMYDKIILQDNIESIDFVIRAGKYPSKTIQILEGNGDYTVSVDTPKIVNAKINSRNELELTPFKTSSEDELTATVTVTDKAGFSTTIAVSVKSELNPYSPEEIEEIKLLNTETVVFNNYKTSSDYKFNSVLKDGRILLSTLKDSYWGETGIKFNLPADLQEGTVSGAKIDYDEFGNMDTSNGEVDLLYLNVVEKSNELIKAVFIVIDPYKETIKTGYFVLKTPGITEE
mgnify:CR=1 FL=1